MINCGFINELNLYPQNTHKQYQLLYLLTHNRVYMCLSIYGNTFTAFSLVQILILRVPSLQHQVNLNLVLITYTHIPHTTHTPHTLGYLKKKFVMISFSNSQSLTVLGCYILHMHCCHLTPASIEPAHLAVK